MNTPHEESTYALIVRSEEKGRIVLEAVLYMLAILSAVTAIFQFAQEPVQVSVPSAAPCLVCSNATGVQG
jgi:hypothetical protein